MSSTHRDSHSPHPKQSDGEDESTPAMTNSTPGATVDSKSPAPAELRPAAASDERVTINVSGRRYETYDGVLRRLPQTLLGDEQRRAIFWDAARGEFFFNRCASSFEGILLAHQTGGQAWRPPAVPRSIFIEDLKFFGFPEQAARLAGGGGSSRSESVSSDEGRCRRLTGQPLRVVVSQLVTLVALVAYAVSTLPALQPRLVDASDVWSRDEDVRDGTWLTALLVVELLCMVLVFAELIRRLVSEGGNCRFFRDPMNALDLVMTVPFFVCFVIVLFTRINPLPYKYKALYWIINLIRLLRLFRIFRVLRETKTGQFLKRVLVASAPALGFIAVIWMVAVMFFAALMFWAEQSGTVHLAVVSIPSAIYWAIITMTTVGYGDIFPHTKTSRFFAALCAYTGYIMIALPIAVLVTKLAQCSREDEKKEVDSNDRLLQRDPARV